MRARLIQEGLEIEYTLEVAIVVAFVVVVVVVVVVVGVVITFTDLDRIVICWTSCRVWSVHVCLSVFLYV